MLELTPQERRALRAKAHHLHPVVSIGQHGLTPPVMQEIDRALAAHGLVKVRVHSDDRNEREAMLARIAGELAAAPVQHLGKLLIVWRPLPAAEPVAKPAKKAPRRKPAKHRAGLASRDERRYREERAPQQVARRARGASRDTEAGGIAPGQVRRRRWTTERSTGSARDDASAPRSRKSSPAPPAAVARRPASSKPATGAEQRTRRSWSPEPSGPTARRPASSKTSSGATPRSATADASLRRRRRTTSASSSNLPSSGAPRRRRRV